MKIQMFALFIIMTGLTSAQEMPQQVQLLDGGYCSIQTVVDEHIPELRAEIWDMQYGWERAFIVKHEIPDFQRLAGEKPIFNLRLFPERRYIILIYYDDICLGWWCFTTLPPD